MLDYTSLGIVPTGRRGSMRDLAHGRVVYHSPEMPTPDSSPLTIGGGEVNGHGEIDLCPREEKTWSHLGKTGKEGKPLGTHVC